MLHIPTLGAKYYGILLLSNRSPHLANREWRLTAHGGEALITMGICVHFYCFKALRWGDVHYGKLYTFTAFKVLGDATFTDGVLTYSEWWWCLVTIIEWWSTSCWKKHSILCHRALYISSMEEADHLLEDRARGGKLNGAAWSTLQNIEHCKATSWSDTYHL